MRKYDFIRDLFDEKSKEIVRSPDAWKHFLTSACRNYRLRFDEQVLVYAQRPDATAVLEIEKWNRNFGRWVNRNAKGIAVFISPDREKQRLKYYFDISDTHESRNARPVPIWNFKEEYSEAVIETLEATFGELEKKDDIVDAVFSAAKNAAYDNLQDYLPDLLDGKRDSFLEELDDSATETFYRRCVENSIAFMLLSRLGYNAAEFFEREDFADVVNFNTPDTLSALGLATSEISEMALNEVSRTILSLERSNRIIEKNNNDKYTGIVINTERSNDYERDNLPSGRQLSDSELSASGEERPSARTVFGASQEVSEGTPQSEVHEPSDTMPSGRAFSRDTDESNRDERESYQGNGSEGRTDGGTESERYDDLGSGNEQPSQQSGGNSPERSDLSVTETEPELPAFTDESKILYMLQNPKDDLTHRKEFAVQRWGELKSIEEKGRYVPILYAGKWGELEIDGETVGYKHDKEGLLLYEGTYKQRTKESLFSWNLVAEIIDGLIKSGEYYKEPEKAETTPQYSLFDMPDLPVEQETEQVSLFTDFGLSQQIIDEALCLGSNKVNSTLDIAMTFRRDRGTKYNELFLKTHYGTNGAGFFFEGEKVSVWYDKDGFNIAKGDTAKRSSATHLSWEQVAKRIRELLDLGRYMPQYQLDKVDDHEISVVADRIVTFYRDANKEEGVPLFPTLEKALEGKYGYPDQVEIVKGLLANPESFEVISSEYDEFMDNRRKGNIYGLYRYAYRYSPEYIHEVIEGMSMEPVAFKAQNGFNPERKYFITEDEINRLIRGHSSLSEAKYRIYTFFTENYDLQERAKMLKNEYGIGGYGGGNDHSNYDGKGLSFSHGSGLEPYAKVELKWTDVARRIDRMIKANEYFYPEEIARIPEIEREHIAKDLTSFFMALPKEYAKPYSDETPAYDIQKVIEAQLVDPQALESIEKMMDDAISLINEEDYVDYPLRKEQYETFISFKNGEYHPYAIPTPSKPLPRPNKFSQPAKGTNEEQDKELNAVNDLLNACKIDDMVVDFENGEIVATDTESEWRGAELYRFLLDDVLAFDENGELADGYDIDEKIINTIKEYAKHYDVEPTLVPQKPRSVVSQYNILKRDYPDTIVFMRVGDFYETFSDDAKVVAKELDLVLTGRNGDVWGERVPMCGVPRHAIDTYISRLVANGYKVALAENEELQRSVVPSNEPDNSLDRAKELITEYSLEEFEHEPDFSDMSNVELAYTETEDGKHTIQVSADLVNFNLNTYVDGSLFKQHKADSLDILIKTQLTGLNFNDLVYLDEEELKRIETEKENTVETLAERLVAFAKDTDFYDYMDNLEIGETDADTISKLTEQLQSKMFCEGAISYITDYIAEISINEQEKLQTFDTPDMTRVENLQTLLDDLSAYTETLADIVKVEAPDNSDLLGEELTIDGRHFVVDSVDGDYVSMRDNTFGEGTGFPIFRRERIENIKPYLTEKEEPIVEILPAPPKQPRTRVQTFDLHPEIPMEHRHDYNFAEKDIESVGKKERFRRNMEAIRVIKECEFDNRFATPEEQEILSQYVGWGGIPEAFDETNSAWADEYKELVVALSPEEYEAARESTLTAFYTPQPVISALYKALGNMGFNQGNILEPSCGIGNFIGMLPDEMKGSKMYGIELDSISAQIAQQLYQTSSVMASPFEKANLPDSFFDAVVGNVPFGDFKVMDKRYDKHNFLIHDYFFAKSLDKLRAGGVMLLVTSKGTMDKENSSFRRYIAQRADLLGAIRLPNDTFKGNAGTEVTSDILILQKRDRIIQTEPDWTHIDTTEDGIRMNKYFVDNPDMVLGNMVMKSGRFGMESTCEPYEDSDLSELLNEAISNIHGEIAAYEIDDEIEEEDNSIPADPDVRNFSFTIVDGEVYFRENSVMTPRQVSATAKNRIKGMVEIRESVRRLIDLEINDYPDTYIQAEQENLNFLYDKFTAKYGVINSRANISAFSDDSSFPLLSALEVIDDEGRLERKADMFTKRTIKPHTPVTSVDTPMEALAVSLGEKAKVDMQYMCELSGKSKEEIVSSLTGVIFRNPLSDEEEYLPADEYLSGNVREKLRIAKEFAENNAEYQINVEALQKVQPNDLTASEIDVRLGATWLPIEDVQDFMYNLLDTPYYARWNVKVHFSEYTGEWNVEGKSYDRMNVKANNAYGTSRVNAYKIIEETLNLKDVRVFDYVEDDEGKRKPVLNKKETAIAQSKQELIKQAFQDWIWSDPERRTRLCKIYNERFNSIRPREYDGSNITFSGMNPEITLREHQKNAVAHILYGGNTLLAHAVGAGKTYEMVAAAQESKRLGLCSKSLFVVPNHLTEQWANEYLQLYPSANILVATKKDFTTKNRKRFCGRIATGDYDAIIIGHSQFEKIPMSVDRQIQILEDQRDEVLEGIAELKHNRGDKFSIKQLERTKKSIDNKLQKLNDQSRKDDVVTFEELGVDRIFIDESHYYKNLFLFTKMRNVGGIAQTEAQKSSDLFMKCRYLDEITGGRGIVFATGTPISNSMVELYTIQRYLQYETLRKHHLQHFDAWASTFGETITAIELTPEGSGYRAKTRFARFYNLPELMSMFKEVADIQTADMLNLPVPKANYHNVSVKPSEIQADMVETLSERADKVRNGVVDSTVDNMLLITNDGRKLALDQRLLNEMLPDNENSKVNACIDNIFKIWEDTKDKKSAQLVFCDLSTPKGEGHFSVYNDIRKKLIERGVPEEEIRFIHEADTEAKKQDLFKKTRSGDVRILLGSTQKMGAGTNVQDRLIALHDLDCPWRPSDLEQRSGRIIRQGNSNPEVEIFRYVTEQTFDAYLYQLVEGKQKFASQIMTSKSPVRSAEDIDETALSYAEIKMLATGNPYIKEKMDLDIQVQKLRLLKSNYLSERYSLEDKILKEYPSEIARLTSRIVGLKVDIVTAKAHPKTVADEFTGMVVNGVEYVDKAKAGEAIINVCKTLPDSQTYPLGEYRGFQLEVFYEPFSHQHRVNIRGAISH